MTLELEGLFYAVFEYIILYLLPLCLQAALRSEKVKYLARDTDAFLWKAPVNTGLEC